jgi:hypothetical protein
LSIFPHRCGRTPSTTGLRSPTTTCTSSIYLLVYISAEAWADAVHDWLKVPDDDMHIVFNGKQTEITGRRFKFLIISYECAVLRFLLFSRLNERMRLGRTAPIARLGTYVLGFTLQPKP